MTTTPDPNRATGEPAVPDEDARGHGAEMYRSFVASTGLALILASVRFEMRHEYEAAIWAMLLGAVIVTAATVIRDGSGR